MYGAIQLTQHYSFKRLFLLQLNNPSNPVKKELIINVWADFLTLNSILYVYVCILYMYIYYILYTYIHLYVFSHDRVLITWL